MSGSDSDDVTASPHGGSPAAASRSREHTHLWPIVSEKDNPPSVFVTAEGTIGFRIDGLSIMKTIEDWHALAVADIDRKSEELRSRLQPAAAAGRDVYIEAAEALRELYEAFEGGARPTDAQIMAICKAESVIERIDFDSHKPAAAVEQFPIEKMHRVPVNLPFERLARCEHDSGTGPEPTEPCPKCAASRSSEVTHEEQLVVWADELTFALMDWLKEPESYDDKVHLVSAMKAEIKSIVEAAFDLAEPSRLQPAASEAPGAEAVIPTPNSPPPSEVEELVAVAWGRMNHYFHASPHGQDAEGHSEVELCGPGEPDAFPLYSASSLHSLSQRAQKLEEALSKFSAYATVPPAHLPRPSPSRQGSSGICHLVYIPVSFLDDVERLLTAGARTALHGSEDAT